MDVRDLHSSYIQLKCLIETYNTNPKELYKELFEDWCELDVIRFYELVNLLSTKDENWQEHSLLILPDFSITYNSLCQIADEIEQRRGDLITDLNEPTDRPETVTLPDDLATPEALKIFEQARELY